MHNMATKNKYIFIDIKGRETQNLSGTALK